jgi:ubiquinone/menaquinone biosynthesis C-methylase UbiE
MIWKDDPLAFAQNRIDSRQYILLPRIGEMVNQKEPRKILDYGCGEGLLGKHIANKDVQFGLFDISEVMTSMAAASLKKSGFDKVNVYETSEAIPSVHFDCIVLSLVLMTINTDQEYSEILNTCYRALKPGGQLLIGLTHPCFRQAQFSTYHTKFTLGHQFNYFNNHEAFDVFVRGSKAGKFIEFPDFHHTLTYTFSMVNKAGLSIVDLEELKDRSIEDSYYNPHLAPYLILKCLKP